MNKISAYTKILLSVFITYVLFSCVVFEKNSDYSSTIIFWSTIGLLLLPYIIKWGFDIKMKPLLQLLYTLLCFLIVYLGVGMNLFNYLWFGYLIYLIVGFVASFFALCLIKYFKIYDLTSTIFKCGFTLVFSLATAHVLDIAFYNLLKNVTFRLYYSSYLNHTLFLIIGTFLFNLIYVHDIMRNEKNIYELLDCI